MDVLQKNEAETPQEGAIANTTAAVVNGKSPTTPSAPPNGRFSKNLKPGLVSEVFAIFCSKIFLKYSETRTLSDVYCLDSRALIVVKKQREPVLVTRPVFKPIAEVVTTLTVRGGGGGGGSLKSSSRSSTANTRRRKMEDHLASIFM